MSSLKKIFHLKNVLGLFVKIGDSSQGYVTVDGRISKPMIKEDNARMEKGTDLCKQILLEAGVDPSSIGIVDRIGGHPGGTAPIGECVDENLETETKGLHICDASVFPRSPGVPPVLTIIALAKRFTDYLMAH